MKMTILTLVLAATVTVAGTSERAKLKGRLKINRLRNETVMTETIRLSAGGQIIAPLLFDSFNRPDTTEPNVGAPEYGNQWLLIGSGGAQPCQWGMIKDGYLTASQFGLSKTIYAVQVLDREPVMLQATFRWEQIAEDGTDGTFVLAAGPSDYYNVIRDIVHVRFHRNAVIYDTIINWQMRGEVAKKRFDDNPLEYGIDHNAIVLLDWEGGRITVFLDGELMIDVVDPPLCTLRGNRAFWETYYSDESPRSKVMIGMAAAYGQMPLWTSNVPISKLRTWGTAFKGEPDPLTPEQLTVEPAGSGQVLCSWTDTNDGKALTDIEGARAAVGPWHWIGTADMGRTDWTWAGAQAQTTYWIRVRARNLGGTSNWTEPKEIKTP